MTSLLSVLLIFINTNESQYGRVCHFSQFVIFLFYNKLQKVINSKSNNFCCNLEWKSSPSYFRFQIESEHLSMGGIRRQSNNKIVFRFETQQNERE